MKFIHKISKITSYIIQICLLIFVLASNSLWGEVIYEKKVTIQKPEDFSNVVREYICLSQNKKEGDVKLTFRDDIKKPLDSVNATRMPGCAVFIPKGKNKGQFYIAQKREGVSTTLHNPNEGGHPFNISFSDHTERQLVFYLAAEALGIPIKLQPRLKRMKFIHKQAHKLKAQTEETNKTKNITGEFHIYTADAPCTGDDTANNNFSCIKYYEVLQRVFPNCQFHIYFTNPSIHPKVEIHHVSNLINTIRKMAEKNATIRKMAEKNATILENYFKIEDDKLKYNISKNLKEKQWSELKENDISSNANKRNQFISIINRMLPRNKEFDESALEEIEDLFNKVFNITNFHYHMVASVSTNNYSVGRRRIMKKRHRDSTPYNSTTNYSQKRPSRKAGGIPDGYTKKHHKTRESKPNYKS